MGTDYNNAPIGIFDSGFGGLTVAREVAGALPHESLIYVGDSARCPYGPRDLKEVRGFVTEIGGWLIERGAKLILIACNTATAAGLAHAQETFQVPVIGVVQPGARAAVQTTHNRRVGVIATQGTIDSGVYPQAITHYDAGISVYPQAAQKFVLMAEEAVREANLSSMRYDDFVSHHYERGDYTKIADEYLKPLRNRNIDTLVLGCTHFPLLETLIADVMGPDVKLISSAQEAARDVRDMLQRYGGFACPTAQPRYELYTTGEDIEEFQAFGKCVFNHAVSKVGKVCF